MYRKKSPADESFLSSRFSQLPLGEEMSGKDLAKKDKVGARHFTLYP